MGHLRITSELLTGSFELRNSPMKIGRGMDCDIQLKHKSVSRHHCIVTERDGRLRIEDLGSTYGTYLNSTQVSDAYADYGDKVRIGRIAIVYEQKESVPVAEPIADDSARTIAPSAPPAPPKKSTPVIPTPPPSAAVRPPAKPKTPASPPAAAPAPKPAPVAAPVAAKRPLPAAAKSPVVAASAAVAAAAAESPAAEESGTSLKRKPVEMGVYNRNNGRKRRDKAERPDYHEEAAAWEEQAAALERGDGPDYAAEAEEWDQVWGRQRKLKGFFGFLSGGPLGGLLGSFAGMRLKGRMTVVFTFFILVGGGLYFGYQQATANVLVPRKKAARSKSSLVDEIVSKAKESLPQTKALEAAEAE